MAAFIACALVFAAWMFVQAKGWPKGFRLSLDGDGHATEAEGGPQGHAGDGGDGGGGD